MYKEASKQKLRIQTSKGPLTIEQLWDLSVTDLDAAAVNLQDQYKESGKKSFLVAKSKKDKVLKLKFDIVLDVLNTKVEAAATLANVKEIKEHNAKILGLIADKQNEEMAGKSIKELEKMLK